MDPLLDDLIKLNKRRMKEGVKKVKADLRALEAIKKKRCHSSTDSREAREEA